MGKRIQCKKCKDIIESKHRHDFCKCRCGAISIDGGNNYTRIGTYVPGEFSELVKELDREAIKK